MGRWVHVRGKVWDTENSHEFFDYNEYSYRRYRMFGFQEILYSTRDIQSSVCFYAIRITFGRGTTSEKDRFCETKESLLYTSDSFFPTIELDKSSVYDNITDPCATRLMPGNTNRSVKFSFLKSEEAVKNAINYIKAIEPDWYLEHGEKLLNDLSLFNRPSVKNILALLKPVTKKIDSWGDTIRHSESRYETHERLDKAIALMQGISGIYRNDKESLLKIISDIEKEVIAFKNFVKDSRADGLIDSLDTIRSEVLGEPKTLKRKHQETQTADKGVQTTFVPGYQGGPSYDELKARVEQLEGELKTKTSDQFEDQRNGLNKVLEEAEKQHNYSPY